MINNYFFKYSLSLLLLSSAAGMLLRLMRVIHIDEINFNNLLFSHNIISFSGWFYSVIFLSVNVTFLRKEILNGNFIKLLFWLTQVALFITFSAFLVNGFNLISVISMACFIILIYLYIGYFVLETGRKNLLEKKQDIEYRFIYAAMFFLVLSTFVIWRLIYHYQADNYYKVEFEFINYFMFNFQLNGWLTFALIALYVRKLKDAGIGVDFRKLNTAFWFLFISLLFSLITSFSANMVPEYTTVVMLFSSTGQLIGMFYLLRGFFRIKEILIPEGIRSNKWIDALFTLFKISFILIFTLPVIAAVPGISEFFYGSRDVITGYIHLFATGFLIFGVFIWLYVMNIIRFDIKLTGAALSIFIFGFVTDLVLLFTNGVRGWFAFPVIPYYHGMLFFAAFMMFLGILLFWIAQLTAKKGSPA
jgi:hypothetical protein